MKILQINSIYEKFSTGRSTKELHEALLEKGYESYVASPKLFSLNTNSYKIGNKLDWKIHALFSRIFGKQAYYSNHATKKLIKYVEKIKPDVIHLRNLHSNYINLQHLLSYIAKTKIPVVITLHDCWFYTGKCMYYIEQNCDKWKEKCGNCPAKHFGNNSWFFDFSSKMLKDKELLFNTIPNLAVIGVSNWVTEDAKKSILKNAQIIKCIYNWIDLNMFKPKDTSSLKKEMKLENKFIILGISMNWTSAKGINVFNELAHILPDDCQIVLVGDDSMVKNKNKKIKFIGTINDVNKLSELYTMADVFVNPSIQETFGKTTAEALSCGTPVVAYNSTATPELIGTDEKCGYLLKDNDPKLYLEKILEIKLKTKSEYSKNARARAEKLFSYKKNVNEYISIYNEIKTK
jgi:glycosyltransferase involved in cell wall biosynthesis